MTELSYSNDALNVRSAFFGTKAIIYVEGDDDVLFWQEIFSKVTDEPVEVEAVGGAAALDDHIAKIASGQLQAIAARDADFLHLLGTRCKDPKVIYTFGYSIENSLYTVSSLTRLVHLWCKSSRVSSTECAAWLNHLSTTFRPLIHLDAANAISGAGETTIGDNCSRYMTSEKSAAVCPSKVADAAKTIAKKISPSAVTVASASIGSVPEDVLMHLRGHVLASAVQRYIVKNAKAIGKKVSISAESLYAAAIAQFSAAISADHRHRNHYIDSAKMAWQAL